VAIVTGIFTIGTAITFVTVHALGVESLGAQRNALGVRLVLLSEGTGGNIIMATQTCFLGGKILLVFSPEFGIESSRMTSSASNRSFLTDIIMVTVGTFVAKLVSMGEMVKNYPAATVVQDDTRRIFLHCRREKKPCQCRNGQNSNN